PNTDKKKALEMTERLRQLCEKHSFTYNDKTIHITFSAGITSTTSDISPKDLIAQVDALLYKAKEEGRNRICVRNTNS
ncbi:MAG: diguanylate cyclase, partial [Candidatus Cloacimonetes bacterium]|nr:diguanylate cyclase [Candidatus Cloacimonadota bacterium]